MLMRNKNISTFIGCDNEYDEAKIALFGAPFDSTTSYRPGTRFASSHMRINSYGLETYSPYQDKDLEDIPVFDCGDLELPFGNTQKALDMIKEEASLLLNDDKIPLMIGGEHLVTLGAVWAAAEKYKELHVIHFDAHADLRDDYLGEKLSHATVIKRIWEILGDNKIFQFGIRSGCREEFESSKKGVYRELHTCHTLSKVAEGLKDKPVYLTIDLDVLDPSVFPATGTPEAGGINFNTLMQAFKILSKLNIVAADINELSPPYDHSGASTALACKILREMLLTIAR
jgi:agmatinase